MLYLAKILWVKLSALCMGSKAIKVKENKVWTQNCSPKICFKATYCIKVLFKCSRLLKSEPHLAKDRENVVHTFMLLIL